MYEKTRGIVLHSLRYGDDSMIVDILTESRGNVSFLVKIPRSRHAAMKAQLLRPLSVLQLEMECHPNRSLQRLKEIHVEVPFVSIPYEPMKGVVALFVGEILYHSLKNEDKNERLFEFLVQSFTWYDMVEDNYVNFHLAFLIKLTRYLGFWPNCEDCGEGMFFDLHEASFTPVRPSHGQCLSSAEAEWVPRFLKMNYITMSKFKMNRQQRNYVTDLLINYYRLHIPNFPQVKSLDVLRETLL